MPSDDEWDRFTRESFARDQRQDERLAKHGATLESTVNLQASLVEVVKEMASKEAVEKLSVAQQELARTQKEQVLVKLAVIENQVMNEPAPQAEGLWASIIRTATTPFRAFLDARTGTQAMIVAGGVLAYLLYTGQLVPIIEAFRGGVEITVEDGGTVSTEDVDADEMNVDAERMNVTTPEAPYPTEQ